MLINFIIIVFYW